MSSNEVGMKPMHDLSRHYRSIYSSAAAAEVAACRQTWLGAARRGVADSGTQPSYAIHNIQGCCH